MAKRKSTTPRKATKKATTRKATKRTTKSTTTEATIAPKATGKATISMSSPEPVVEKRTTQKATRRAGSAQIKFAAPSHDQIAARAYEIWLNKGCPTGEDVVNWKQAEAELLATA